MAPKKLIHREKPKFQKWGDRVPHRLKRALLVFFFTSSTSGPTWRPKTLSPEKKPKFQKWWDRVPLRLKRALLVFFFTSSTFGVIMAPKNLIHRGFSRIFKSIDE